jgi:hypothetical protein
MEYTIPSAGTEQKPGKQAPQEGAAKPKKEKAPEIIPRLKQAYAEAIERGDVTAARAIAKESEKSAEFVLTDAQQDALAREGEAFKEWYSDFFKQLEDFLGPHKEYAPLLRELLAITSVRTDVKSNVTKAVNELLHYVEHGMFSTDFAAHRENLERALRGERVSGPKVDEFSPALHGDPFTTTMDVHMFRIFFGNSTPTQEKRLLGEDAIRRAAHRLGWTPTQLQAALWGAQLANQGADVSSDKTYGAQLEKHRQKLEEVFRREAVHGGRGIEFARTVARGISERAGIERAAREEAFKRAGEGRGLESQPRAKRPKRESAEAEAGRLAARGAPAAPAPSTTTTTPAGRVEYPKIGNIFQRRWKGMAQVFRESKSPVMQAIGNKLLQFVDKTAALRGDWGHALVPNGALQLTNRAKASREFHQYRTTFREHGQAAADALPIGAEAKRLVQAGRDTMAKVNAEIARVGLKVYNMATGGTSVMAPLGDHPNILSPETVGAINERGKNQAHWDRLKDAMVREGIIPAGPTPADTELAAHNYARKVLDQYNVNSGTVAQKMPAMAYDDTLAGLARFVDRLAEQVARQDVFGTKFFTPGKAAGVNIFDLAQRDITSERERSYVDIAEQLAYGREGNNAFFSAAANLTTVMRLANWKSTMRNLIGGMILNPIHLGITRQAAQLANLKGLFRAIQDGKQLGILTQDQQQAMQDAEKKGLLGKAAGFGLRAHLYGAVEKVSRGYAIMGSRSYLAAAIKAFDKDPTSRASRLYLGRFKRLGFDDPAGLLAENGRGPLTDTYIRRQVNAIQSGYTFADSPQYLSTHEGRFVFQFGKYGTEQATQFEKEILGPFVRMAPGVPKETVSFTDKAGNKQTVKVPGQVMPLVRMLALMGAAGQGMDWFFEWLLGEKSKYASWNEIFTKANRGDRQAIADAFDKVAGFYTQMGAMGIVTDKLKRAFDAGTGRTTWGEAIATIPAVQAATDLADIVQDFFAREDYDNIEGWKRLAGKLTDAVSGVKVYKQMAGRLTEAGYLPPIDIFGEEYRLGELTAKKQDLSWTKATNRRIDAELGIKKPTFLGGSGATPETSIKDRVFEALMSGDSYTAKQVVREEAAKYKNRKDRDDFMRKMEASIRAKQPVYGEGGPMGEIRMKWAKKNLRPDELDRYKRIQEDYVKTAKRAGFLQDLKPPKPGEVSDKLAMLKRARERREQESLLHPLSELMRPFTEPAAESALSLLRGAEATTNYADYLYKSAFGGVNQ